MNIFIDSNILFKDYFFENKSNNNILEYCQEGLLSIYMSEIVRLELRRQFQKELLEKNTEIKKIIKDSKRLKFENNLNLINIDKHLEKFDEFYNRFESIDNFYILNYTNDFLPDIVDRAINRKKPFSEEKSELKDAIIWKTYSEFVEKRSLENCIFLTNNTSDFCAKKDKSKIHLDLIVDTNKFIVINKSFEFIKKYGSSIESPENKFKAYFDQVEIDDDSICKIIKENFEDNIRDEIHSEVDNTLPSDLFSYDYVFDAQLVPYGCEILDCNDIEYEIIHDKALISGFVHASCEIEILEYNSVRDKGEDRFKSIGERTAIYRIYFNFDLQEDELYTDFEVTDIEMKELI